MTGGSTTSPRTSRPHAEAGRGWATDRWATGLLRFAFAALLLVTGLAKLVDFQGFVAVVETYRFFPEALLVAASAAVAAAELVLGSWLFWGRRLTQAALATILIHLGYFGWLLLALGRGLAIPNCGCFGVFWPRPLTPWTLLEDGILLLLALILYLAARRSRNRPLTA